MLTLIKERIAKAQSENPGLKGVLVDGYPRELDQGLQFEKTVSPVDLIIFFDVRNETLISRLLGRAAAAAVKRADDNEETIKKRIEIFNEKNGQIVDHYKDKCLRVMYFFFFFRKDVFYFECFVYVNLKGRRNKEG